MLVTLLINVAVLSFSAVLSEAEERSKTSEDYVPCEAGWYYFHEKCYRIFARKTFERLTWENALERCKNYHGADLVSIQSQEEQDFVVSFLQLDVKSWVWVGLNDRDQENAFRWTDGSVLNYTNWKQNQPDGIDSSGGEEDCVHLVFEPQSGNVGKWNDRGCHIYETYACEKKPNPRKKSPNEMYCSPEAGGGWKYEKSCYHVIKEMKSWQNAERYCKNYHNGHLVAITDVLEDYFLDHISTDIEDVFWIGIKVQEELQQKWSSGWYVSYDVFNKEQLNFKDGTCVARKNRGQWLTIPCTEQLPFICEVSTVSPPVLKLPRNFSYCPKEFDEWRDLGGEYCYYFEKEKARNFFEANFDCIRKGGHLVSLHSKEDSDMLLPFMKYIDNFIYIGLFRRFGREEEFAWTDGSEFNYENWKINEPNDLNEKCVEVLIHDDPNGVIYTWNDVNCNTKRHYICSVKKVFPKNLKEDNCESFCIDDTSHLFELIKQSTAAKPFTCEGRC